MVLLVGCYDKHSVDRAYLQGLMDAQNRVREEWLEETNHIQSQMKTWGLDSLRYHEGKHHGLFRAKTQIEVLIDKAYDIKK